jgi:transposase
MVAEAGCELWYLPPYSPDLNKIERWWFVLKNWMRQRWDEFETFRDCVDAAFKYCPNVLPSNKNSSANSAIATFLSDIFLFG